MSNQERKVAFVRIRDVKKPNRAHDTDAGTDFYCPEYNDEFLSLLKEKNAANRLTYMVNGDELTITVPAGEQVNIPSGIRVWIYDKTTYLQATNKSGIASKLHCVVGANTIDADYQGEVHINLINTGNVDIEIKSGQKLTQFIHKHYINTEWQEMTQEEYDKFGVTARGEGGFGSTTLQ